MAQKVYTLPAAAQFVGVGASTLRRAIERGELRTVAVEGGGAQRLALIEERELASYRKSLATSGRKSPSSPALAAS